MNYKLKIREFRELKGLTQKELAAEIGISQSFLSEVENNKYDIKVSLLGRIGNALSIDPHHLAEYIPDDDLLQE